MTACLSLRREMMEGGGGRGGGRVSCRTARRVRLGRANAPLRFRPGSVAVYAAAVPSSTPITASSCLFGFAVVFARLLAGSVVRCAPFRNKRWRAGYSTTSPAPSVAPSVAPSTLVACSNFGSALTGRADGGADTGQKTGDTKMVHLPGPGTM